MQFLVLSFLALCACAFAQTDDNRVFVKTVQQNYDESIDKRVVRQIKLELTASYIYQAYASYFQRADVSLPGIQKFFEEASKEERGHAQQLIDYVNKRGGHAQFENIDPKKSCEIIFNDAKGDESGLVEQQQDQKKFCICGFVVTKEVNTDCIPREQWQEGLMAFEDALVMERHVNQKLLDLHGEADKNKDAHLTHILEHDFLEEQVHAIKEIANYVTRLRSFTANNGANYKLGEYLFDQKLKS